MDSAQTNSNGHTVTFQNVNEVNENNSRNKMNIYERQNSTNEERTYKSQNPGNDSKHFVLLRTPSVVERYARPTLYRLQSAFNSNTVKYVFICSLLLNVICFAAIVGLLTWKFSGDKNPRIVFSGDKNPRIECYPCGSAGIPGVAVQFKTSNGLCCLDPNQNDFAMMREKNMFPVSAVAATFRNDIIKQVECGKTNGDSTSYSGKKPVKTAALLTLDTKQTKKNNTLEWQTKSMDAFVIGDVTLSKNKLCLTNGGLVSVHSHFGLDTVNNELIQKNKQFVTHCIFKHPRNVATRSIAMDKVAIGEDTYKSTDLEISLQLRSNECVSVYLSHPSLIYDMPISNFFQIVLLN